MACFSVIPLPSVQATENFSSPNWACAVANGPGDSLEHAASCSSYCDQPHSGAFQVIPEKPPGLMFLNARFEVVR